MNRTHTFKAHLKWHLEDINKEQGKKFYSKSHEIDISNKEVLHVSAAKNFKGDPSLYNPEDLLLSSLMSCHMMSYLYVCGQNDIKIIAYDDHAEAVLETYDDGSGKIIAVHLHPNVVIEDENKIELAVTLHQEANKLCFIANSCNFKVYHKASCTAK